MLTRRTTRQLRQLAAGMVSVWYSDLYSVVAAANGDAAASGSTSPPGRLLLYRTNDDGQRSDSILRLKLKI